MLILLPPSEGKTSAVRGASVDVASLSWPSLLEARLEVAQAVQAACAADPESARVALGLSDKQEFEILRNANLFSTPAARASKVYTGVLFDALGFDTLSPSAKRRAKSSVAISSAMWGLLRPDDRIPAYRLSADSRIEGLGGLRQYWNPAVGEVIGDVAGTRGVVVDLRSGAYADLAPVPQHLADRTCDIRVLTLKNGKLTVVSHFNKATKGRIVRALLESGASPRSIGGVAEAITSLGWPATVHEPERARDPWRIDVVTKEV